MNGSLAISNGGAKTRPSLVAMALAALFPLTPGCHVTESSEQPSKELERRLAELVCRRKEECCPGLYAGQDTQACRTTEAFSIAVRADRIGAAVRRGNAEYDAARFGKCVEALDQFDCTSWIRASGGALPAACLDYVRGRLTAGSACRDHMDCVTSRCAFENPPPSGQQGTEHVGSCQPRLAAAETCSSADEDCLVELECRARADGGYACIEGAPAASACTQGSDCDSNVCQSGSCIGECRLTL